MRDTDFRAIEELYSGYVQEVRAAGKKVQLPALPGHDNTAVNEAPFIFPRENGQTLRHFLKTMDAAKPDIVVITSFNEWFEMTQIEPSRNWPDPYIYLKVIAEWRGKKWRTPPLPPKHVLDPLR